MATGQVLVKKPGLATDPLWYKDAIIYELHVRAFHDSNNDGIGDFPGLIEKLDYLQELGVTCLWLLPFFPSPLRDDGYDISDYVSVNPSYGTIEDFQRLLDEAHARGLQVMIELVINHTSDQHPWFQRARQAPAGSPERDYYVWSDTDQKYKDARIIFTDTEKSNWTWDPEAQQYYWHRFFSHQPDLNFDNPKVLEEVISVMRFWLDMGVDGLRLDAIPYLVERDGTNCENLPETHALIKAIRSAMDDGYLGRMILAEANQWPADVRPYFGDGDECHMAFHFPLMPRIYMALRQEDRLPITDIIAQTPDIPDNCQWGIFLRNHDELTLEMVSEDERDYMYLAYSADPRMRINIGIRRRLAPLLDNNRRRIELLNSLLFSFPGTPILYYGDEIGMGDNIYLGDRNGVRTPMQWTADRNAGFSRANPAKLFSPVVMDPLWGYEAINVEAQQSDASSLLNWMRNMIALRKLFQVFGRGSMKFLEAENRKVLAYLREYNGERALCVANLSRFAQPVALDLSDYVGMVPVEMLGYVEFPAIGKDPYPLTMGPYEFLWLELQPGEEPVEVPQPVAEERLHVNDERDWSSLLTGRGVELLEKQLPEYLQRQRWFGGKSRLIVSAAVTDWALMEQGRTAMLWVRVEFSQGQPDVYLMPMGMSFGEEAGELLQNAGNAVVTQVFSRQGAGVLHDGLMRDRACSALLGMIANGERVHSQKGDVRGEKSSAFEEIEGPPTEGRLPRRLAAEQSNTSIFFGDRMIMKLFRRQQDGPNPDTEIGRFLTEKTEFRNVAPFGGSIEFTPHDGEGEGATLAMLQGVVPNEGDGWAWTLEELDRYYESSVAAELPEMSLTAGATLRERLDEIPEAAREHAGISMEAAWMLGRRTAEMHLALASDAQDPDFAPEPMDSGDLEKLQTELLQDATRAFDALKGNLARLPDNAVEAAGLVLSRRSSLLERYSQLNVLRDAGAKIRVHGDYHLGQLLRSKGDFVILDFEGEPARTLTERRAKQSPLKDVAGMVRSFSYAASAAMVHFVGRRPAEAEVLEPWARLWESSTTAEYLRAYRETMGSSPIVPQTIEGFEVMLRIFTLDKALYELNYELNHRPDWVRVPLNGILYLP
jgi:maltose alpha-D-glucosyltransferase / alpha-amylase